MLTAGFVMAVILCIATVICAIMAVLSYLRDKKE